MLAGSVPRAAACAWSRRARDVAGAGGAGGAREAGGLCPRGRYERGAGDADELPGKIKTSYPADQAVKEVTQPAGARLYAERRARR